MTRLKPCPFCGGQPHYESTIAKGETWLRCSQCNVGINPSWYFGDLGTAEEAWNRRAESAAERLASQICQTLRNRWKVAITSSEDREIVARMIESQIGKS